MDATSMRSLCKKCTINMKCLEENSVPKSTTVKSITMEVKAKNAKNRKKFILDRVIAPVVIVGMVLITAVTKNAAEQEASDAADISQ